MNSLPKDDSQALPAGTQLEEFIIERVLGSGGFGITYLARDTLLNRHVVIKENLPVQFCIRDSVSLTVAARHSQSDDAENFKWSLENFSREASILASLDHPGIVRVLRSFLAFGTAYFVMPFVEGETLDDLIQRRLKYGPPLSETELRGILERLLDALDHLHQRGIYHRDIKPGNILITSKGNPVLIDFGSARQRLGERSMTVIESPGYTPFEQHESRGNVGPWSDLYALGATLEKAITGHAPDKVMDRMRLDPRIPLTRRIDSHASYSLAFLQTIDKALEVPEADRWQDASKWMQALIDQPVVEKNATTPKSAQDHTKPVFPEPNPVDELKKNATIIHRLVSFCVASGSTGLKIALSEFRKRPKIFRRIVPAFTALILTGVIISSFGESDRDEDQTLTQNQERLEQQAVRKVKEALRQAQELSEKQRLQEQKQREKENQAAEESRQNLQQWQNQKKEKDRLVRERKMKYGGDTPGEVFDFEVAPGLNMRFCWVPAGKFLMGSMKNDPDREADEDPREVRFSRGFWMGKTEVTQAQWEAVMGYNPSQNKGSDHPVESVSWDAVNGSGGFVTKVNRHAGNGSAFALPTESQWEYACRAGTTGGRSDDLDAIAWHNENSDSTTHPVGRKKPNAWGLHDMLGNVREWCEDSDEPVQMGDDSVTPRIHRGGGYGDGAQYSRAANRNSQLHNLYKDDLGFRLVRHITAASGSQGNSSPQGTIVDLVGKDAGSENRAKTDHPFATQVPNKPGFVFSPFTDKVVDVGGIPKGTLVEDPTSSTDSKKYFRVP